MARECTADSRAGRSVLHGESGGQSMAEAIHEGVGGHRHGEEEGGALLLIRPLLPQADAHLEQHGVDTDGHHRFGTVRTQVQERTVGEQPVGSSVQDSSGQLAGKRRSKQEGAQEHDAIHAAQGAAGGSEEAQSKKRRLDLEQREEGGLTGSVLNPWTTYEFDRGVS